MNETIERSQVLPLQTPPDIVVARQTVRDWAVELGLSLVDQTKTITAASELARNTIVYGLGGTMRIERIASGAKRGLRLIFEDGGPGIPDIELALKDGYTTGNGLGMGLSGARRLMNQFHIESEPGKGTRVCVIKWK